jgi:hypothetical protein
MDALNCPTSRDGTVLLHLLMKRFFFYERDIVKNVIDHLHGTSFHIVEIDQFMRPTTLALSTSDRNPDCDVYVIVNINIFGCDRMSDLSEEIVVKTRHLYEEDGSAGSYEGSGYGAHAGIRTTRDSLILYNNDDDDDDDVLVMVPLEDFWMQCMGYSHCSCYGASTACGLSDDDDTRMTPGEIEM